MHKPTLTLRRALVLVVTLGLLAPAALLGGYFWHQRVDVELPRQTRELLAQHTDILAGGMQEPLWNLDRASGRALVDAMMSRNPDLIRVDVRDNALGVFVSSERAERRAGFSAVEQRPVVYRGSTIGTVNIELGSSRLRQIMMRGLTEQLIAVCAQAALSIALILLLLERRLTQPLQRLGEGAARLANRELDEPFTWTRPDEIGVLSQRLERTRLSLRTLFADFDQKQRELEVEIERQRRAREAMHQSEAKFAGAFQCNPDPIALTRVADGQIMDVNQEFEKATGYQRQEILGKTTVELDFYVDLDDRDRLVELLRRHGMVRDFPWRVRTRHGEILECLTNGVVFRVDGEPHILAVIRNVTDQRRIERQKAEADRALMRLAHGAQNMSSESFFELLAADLAAALGTDCAFIALREAPDSDRLQTMVNHVRGAPGEHFAYAATGSPCQGPLAGATTLFPSGLRARFPLDRSLAEKGWDSYAGAPLRGADGSTVGVLAVLHTGPLANPALASSLLQVFSERASFELERKRAEQALRNSQQSFASIFHSSPVAMSVILMEGKYPIRDVNSAFERLFLIGRDKAIGSSSLELGLYCDPEVRARTIEIVERDGRRAQYEAWMRRSDGTRVYAQVSENSFYVNHERLVTTVFEDISEQHRIEHEIRDLNANLERRVEQRTAELQRANAELAATLQTLHRAQEDLVRSEKLAALGALVAGIAHELNTPIGNSMMVASTLADHTRAVAAQLQNGGGLKRSTLDSYLDVAGKAGEILMRNLRRSGNLVASFKQVAMDQTSSQRRRFALSETVSEIMMTLWPMLRKTPHTVVQKIPGSIRLDSYPGPLGQVLTNLVNNAVLHGFEGKDKGTIEIAAEALDDDWIELRVKDDGVGIAQANLSRIFDPFFTTKLGSGGSGLGLNIAHNIVTGILGGRIRVLSEPGAGAVFILTLPTQAPHKQPEPAAMPPVAE